MRGELHLDGSPGDSRKFLIELGQMPVRSAHRVGMRAFRQFRMQQVFLNLAVNARDAMLEGGKLTISLDRLQVKNSKTAPLVEMEPGEWIQIMVSDTGMGIAEEKLPHIYEPFFS